MAEGPAGERLGVEAALARVSGARARLRGASAEVRALPLARRVKNYASAHPLLTIAAASAAGFFVARVARRVAPRALRAVRDVTATTPTLVEIATHLSPMLLAALYRRGGGSSAEE